MLCPNCHEQERSRLTSSPCPKCGHVWWDTEDYTRHLVAQWGGAKGATVLDIGCGNKGVIAEAFWRETKAAKIYACDRHVIKKMSPPVEPLLMDAENLLTVLGPDSVDFVTHCGLLEHIEADKALRILHVLERITRKGIFFTCSSVLRKVDGKVLVDGNPFHYYKSCWGSQEFEALGYTMDVERMANQTTFLFETTGWCQPKQIATPWEERVAKCRAIMEARTCSHEGCAEMPKFWYAVDRQWYCLEHGMEHRPDILNQINGAMYDVCAKVPEGG